MRPEMAGEPVSTTSSEEVYPKRSGRHRKIDPSAEELRVRALEEDIPLDQEHARNEFPYGGVKHGIGVVVPAHNEDDDLLPCLESIYAQTMLPDMVVVLANNCTDSTVKVAEDFGRRMHDRFGDRVTFVVYDMQDNEHKKPGALNQYWREWGRYSTYILGVDADTILGETCIEALYNELSRKAKAGGVMARYTFDQNQARNPVSSFLIRLQRMEFTSWSLDLMRANHETYVLGGQATLFRTAALARITDHFNRAEDGPWSYDTAVEDMELTWRLNDLGFRTYISDTARAFCGPMHTFKALWAQRLKWDKGIMRLMREQGATSYYTKIPRRQDRKMWLSALIRILFAILLAVAIQRGAWVWFWWWIIPPILSIVLNFRISQRMPYKTGADSLMALTYVAMEFYLVFRLLVWGRSKISVARGSKTDDWSRQAKAEGKG